MFTRTSSQLNLFVAGSFTGTVADMAEAQAVSKLINRAFSVKPRQPEFPPNVQVIRLQVAGSPTLPDSPERMLMPVEASGSKYFVTTAVYAKALIATCLKGLKHSITEPTTAEVKAYFNNRLEARNAQVTPKQVVRAKPVPEGMFVVALKSGHVSKEMAFEAAVKYQKRYHGKIQRA